MDAPKKSNKEIQKRIEKLIALEEEVTNEKRYAVSITKLLVLKYLCRDALAMCEFALFIALKIHKIIDNEVDSMSDAHQVESLKIVNSIIEIMREIIAQSQNKQELYIEEMQKQALSDLYYKTKKYNDVTKKGAWGIIRTIENKNMLLIEEAVECFIYNYDPKNGYLLARSYTEKYESSFGSGLIPKSVPYLRQVVAFWQTYYQSNSSNSDEKTTK